MKNRSVLLGGIVAVAFFTVSLAEGPVALSQAGISEAAQLRSSLSMNRDFGKMPLCFIPNEGQLDGRVNYYVQGQDRTLYFTSGGVTMALSGRSMTSAERFVPGSDSQAGEHERSKALGIQRRGFETEDWPAGMPSERWVVKLDFVGADQGVKPVGVDESGAVVSYFKGKPADWKTGLATYSKIVYRDLWAGIDLVYSGTVNRLKYEFVVHPGADPSDIRLAYRGVTGLAVTEEGRLEVAAPLGSFHDDIPVAYQEAGGKRVPVDIAYKLEEKYPARAKENSQKYEPEEKEYSYRFEVGDYTPGYPLILDPAIYIYCGFIGGSSEDNGYAITVDGLGNAYVTGHAWSNEASFPVAVGPDLTHNGGWDAFVAKVRADGTALVYCGFIGGGGGEEGRGIAVDGSGSAYIGGSTSSNQTTFPVVVGPDLTYNGLDSDAFVAKVNPAGTALVYCGYIGGWDNEWGRAIAVDRSGNAYLTGVTRSNETHGFPVAVGPDLTHNGSDWDAFVAKVKADGTGLVYCGYIGGTADEDGYGIAVDSSGSAYVTGYTNSSEASFPVSVGPDLTSNGGDDAFVAKVKADGTGLVYCGYIGGSGSDYGTGIAVDGLGNAHVTGYTNSSEASFPAAVGPDVTYNGGWDAFVAKVKADGTGHVYCGYIGGGASSGGYGIAVDQLGNAYVAGDTSHWDSLPVIVGPGLTNSGNGDGFIARLKSDGTAFLCCGYVGGGGYDICSGIAVDGIGNAYITGHTGGLPAVVGPDLTVNGSYDAFVAKLSYWELWEKKHAVGDFDGDGADEAAVDFGASGTWLYDNGAWTQLTASDPESLMVANLDGDADDEILADLGASGLWLWNSGGWFKLSGVNVEGMAAGDVDADGSDEVVGDFGTVGMWLYNGGTWTQLSGVNADYVAIADLDGSGGKEIVGDFGTTGLWIWNTGVWQQLSGVNPDYVTFGNTNGLGGQELLGDFGATGLWLWSAGSGWTQLSGVNPDYVIAADADGSGDCEVFGDFAVTGLWLWDSGSWAILSGVNAEFMIGANVDGGSDVELVADFGSLGLWLWDGGSWTQLSGMNPEYIFAGDMDGDNQDEILGDFGTLGLWMWNSGSWSQISPINPE
jgi:hypothetical protein